jgi:hypothetical protein
MVVRHRYEVYESSRRATLGRLLNEYQALCRSTSTADVLNSISRHRNDGLLHDPAAIDIPGSKVRQVLKQIKQPSPYDLHHRLPTPRRASSQPTSARGSERSSSVPSLRQKLTPAELHEMKQQRLQEQFERTVQMETDKTQKILTKHQHELEREAALRRQRDEEARLRRDKGAVRNFRIERARTAAQELAENTVARHEALLDYADHRSLNAIESHNVEVLAEREYQKALKAERERMVKAHEQQIEFQKLCILQSAQQREASVNQMLHAREIERRRMREERRQLDADLKAATDKLKADLLTQKRKGLLQTLTPQNPGLPPRAKSALS